VLFSATKKPPSPKAVEAKGDRTGFAYPAAAKLRRRVWLFVRLSIAFRG
jgi:hypothetical protein